MQDPALCCTVLLLLCIMLHCDVPCCFKLYQMNRFQMCACPQSFGCYKCILDCEEACARVRGRTHPALADDVDDGQVRVRVEIRVVSDQGQGQSTLCLT